MLILLQLLSTLAVFSSVFLLIYVVFRYPVTNEPALHRRVASAMGQDRSTLFDWDWLKPILAILMEIARRIGLSGLRQRISKDLDASGNPSGYSVDEYLVLCLLSGTGLGIITAVLDLLLGGSTIPLTLPFMTAMGLAIPLITLRGADRARRQRISKTLPYALDLIALVVEAGASFNEAIQTLIRDEPDDDLNHEFSIMLSEIDLGATRAAAMSNMADRIGLDNLRSVVAAVAQADRLGTPLASILKLQAEMLRNQRSVRAEKLSASASLRILVPSMLILLAVVAIVFGPIIIRAAKGELF